MCTHTTTHHTPCNCISTRTTAPCTETQGAGYRGSLCPAFEYVQLFIDVDDRARCLRHPEGQEVLMKDGSLGRKKGADVGMSLKAGVVKEIVKKIDGIKVRRENSQVIVAKIDETNSQEEMGKKTSEKNGLEGTSKDIDEMSGQDDGMKHDQRSSKEQNAKKIQARDSQDDISEKIEDMGGEEDMVTEFNKTKGEDNKVKKIDTTNGQEGMVEQHIDSLIDHLHSLSPTPQSTPFKLTSQALTKSNSSPQFGPQTPPRLNLDTKPTTLRADTTCLNGKYSDSDYDTHDLDSPPACVSPTPQSTPFKSIVQATNKTRAPPQTPPQRHLNTKPTLQTANFSPSSICSDSDYSHHSDPFYITTPTTQPTTPLTPQTSFSSTPNAGIIYGGTSLLHVPIDGTKWNWNGTQWIGLRAAPVPFVGVEHDKEEFAFRRKRSAA